MTGDNGGNGNHDEGSMTMTYDRRQAAAGYWDQSILSITPSELAGMHPDERSEELEAALDRAGDLAEAITVAFKADLGSDLAAVLKAVKTLQGVARKSR